MNKRDYLAALEKSLKSAGVRDYDDILEEYSEHFDMKIADGFDEEEIAEKLASPDELAGQFKEIGTKEGGLKREKKGNIAVKICKVSAVILLDLVIYPTIFALYVWVFAFGVVAITNAAAGIFMASGLSQITQDIPYMHIPPMPYICALLLGLSLLGLAVLSAVGTEYCRLYINQILRKYARWHKNVLGSPPPSPPLPLNPWMTPKKRRVMRTMALISLVVFAIGLIAATASMMIIAGAFEPWHVWGWFV